MIARYGIYESPRPTHSKSRIFSFTDSFPPKKDAGIVCAFCENSNVVTIPIISQNKYQERLFNDFIAKKRLESNVFRPLF